MQWCKKEWSGSLIHRPLPTMEVCGKDKYALWVRYFVQCSSSRLWMMRVSKLCCVRWSLLLITVPSPRHLMTPMIWSHHPNHLLLLKNQASVPPGVFKKKDAYARRRWKQSQYLADLFWSRWTREYLPLLQEWQKWFRTKRNFQLGDIVLIVDGSAPRNSWMIGRVLKTMPDTKGALRRVSVQTKTSVLVRPVSKLCLLHKAEWWSPLEKQSMNLHDGLP